MKKRLPVILVVLTVVLGGGYLIDRNRAAHESRLSGFFESQPTLASSRLGGRVKRILVKEGDSVRAGQTLVEFESESYEASVEAERQGAEQAQAQLAETQNGPRKEEIRQQDDVLLGAEVAYRKAARGARPEEIHAAFARAVQADSQYRKLLRGARPEEIRAANAAEAVARGKLAQARRGLTDEEKGQLKARLDGAIAAEDQAQKEFVRSESLYREGARSRQQYEAAQSAYLQAQALRKEAQEAYDRALKGTPPEELNQAEGAYRQAKAQADQVRNGARKEDIEAARQEMLATQANLDILINGTRPEDVQAAKARRDQAQALLDQLKNGSRAEDIAKARAAVKQAEARVKSVEANLKENKVVAGANSTVDRILIAAGDLVSAGAPVVQLSNPGDIWLRVYLPEAQLNKVKVGDDAEIKMDGVSDSLAAVVESIASQGEFTPANLQSPDERGKQVFAIRLRLKTPDLRVKAGMYATVTKVGQWP